MAFVDLSRRTSLPVEEVWRRVTDFESYAEYLPFTSIEYVTQARSGIGCRFVMRSGVGRFGYEDLKEATEWRPPGPYEAGALRLQRLGEKVSGWAYITVTPTLEGGSAVGWHDEARFKPFDSLADLPFTLLGHRVYGRMLNGLLSEAGTDEVDRPRPGQAA